MAIGNHAVIGEVIRYWISDTTWIKVSPETEVRESESNSRGYVLGDNYPNPFNPSTIISYQLPATALVTMKVYDVLGRGVATLVNERQSPGTYSVIFNAAYLQSGVYFLQTRSWNIQSNKETHALEIVHNGTAVCVVCLRHNCHPLHSDTIRSSQWTGLASPSGSSSLTTSILR